MPHRLRLLERAGRALGFSPEGRPVRVWVVGAPGGDETEVVHGTIAELREGGGAVIHLAEPRSIDGRELRDVLAVPRERGWGLDALWFSFIAVDVYELGGAPDPVARWFLRLGR
ncbi:MAG TPA: hypothetical protein VGF25_18865 [Thermoleophilaceae bacterium]|jgi:hypothetical protein